MTTANKITVVRIVMIPAFVTMAIYYGESITRGQPLEWQRLAAIAIFILAAVSDGLDGYVARRYNQRSTLGIILDPIADKGLLLSGIITLSLTSWSEVEPESGKFPVWFPVLVISRDAILLVGTLVLYLLNGKVHIKPHWTGKVATVLQMIAIGWVVNLMQRGKASWGRIMELMQEKPAIFAGESAGDSNGTGEAKEVTGALRFEDVEVKYPAGSALK